MDARFLIQTKLVAFNGAGAGSPQWIESMIKLSRLADYAVVLLTQMGSDAKGVHTAIGLAARTGLPVPTVSKVLATLARDGVVSSVRGAKGGYRLAATPERITVAQIIAAIDGPIALTQCVDRSADICTVETLCPSRAGWHKINEAVERALSEVSLAELMGTPALFAAPARESHETTRTA